MRPVTLVISAFGPYSKSVRLDMEKLGRDGLYLITGDTGAGKTTIFDAITYALFGEASGSNRTVELLRSKYADSQTPTFVEMDFMLREKLYHIRRNPEYLRPSKRGAAKETKETAKAELVFPDGRTVSGIASVNHEIEQLLGLNKQQFTQIAMIPQGDFLKLLLAGTKERIAIFREIFDTKKYVDLQNELSNDTKKLYIELEDSKKSILKYLKDVQCSEDSVYADMLENVKKDEGMGTLSDTLELIGYIIEQDSEKLSAAEKAIDVLNKEIAKLDNDIGKQEHLENIKKELVSAEEAVEVYIKKEKDCKLRFEAAKAGAEERSTFAVKIAALENELPQYKKYGELELHLTEKLNRQKNLTALINEKREQIEKLAELKVQYGKEREELKDSPAQLERNSARLESHEHQFTQLKELTDSVVQTKKLINEMYLKRKNYMAAVKEFEELQVEYQRLESLYFDEQAGILAEKLKTGQPCPVCGSLDHPAPAVLSGKAPAKKELDKLKARCEEKSKKRSELSSLSGMAKGQAESAYFEMLKRAKLLLKLTDETLAECESASDISQETMIAVTKQVNEAAENMEEELREKMSLLQTERKSLDKAVSRQNELEKLIPECEKSHRSSEEELAELIRQQSVLETEAVAVKNEMHSLKNSLSYENIKQAEQSLNMVRLKSKQAEQEYNTAEKEYRDCKLQLETSKNRVEDLKRQLDGQQLKSTSVAELKEERNRKEQQKNEMFGQKKQLDIRLEINTNAKLEIVKLSDNMSELEKKYQWMRALCNTACGTISGRQKIMLETYVQMAFFDRIIVRANTRFMVMTGGQYEMVRSKGSMQGQSGLELDIIDHYNGTVRSVRSLSGGESFKASLAMALGLSDEIQSQAGGIQIDTMFIDEGFGALDEESLRQSVEVLIRLSESNRLVGIISHVSELKERIDLQIAVTKNKEGGSSARIILS